MKTIFTQETSSPELMTSYLGLWQRVMLRFATNVSEDLAASIFRVMWNSPSWKPQISQFTRSLQPIPVF